MADYFLKATDGSRAYRLVYVIEDSTGAIRVSEAHAVGHAGSVTPSQTQIVDLDQPVTVEDVLVELVLDAVVAGTAADYRTVAKAQIDGKW
jgi:phenylalanyl-tRNA synthetase beta subunit